MENHTKRIRKARRQGLATKKPSDLGEPTRRLQLRGQGMQPRDIPGEMRATDRRDSVVTKRKAKRQIRGSTRRATSRRTRTPRAG
jgi:hypothetical protein